MALQSAFGFIVLVAFAWVVSENRRKVDARIVIAGSLLQIGLAALILNFPPIKSLFLLLNEMVGALERSTVAGTSFVFGYLGGGPLPFDEKNPGMTFIFAFRGLPLVLVISALSSLLFYWRILPVIVRAFAWALRKTMGVNGPVGLSTAANIFVGMVEAPLFVRPYLAGMTRSEMFIVMTGGMATIAGTVMVLYSIILSKTIPDAMGHILTASIISAPAAIMTSLIMIPETQATADGGADPRSDAKSSMDAITKGTAEGVTLLINIIAMLVVLVALVALVNQLLGVFPMVDGKPLTLQTMLGWVMAPVTWLMGVPWGEAKTAGSLMGIKTVLNELLAYLQMSQLPEGALSPRSRLIMTYAMCGFANFGSLGIMIGGMGTMAPEKKDMIVSLGMKSILAGTLSTCMTGAVVGIVG
ncbi:MAG: nucleoside:proton symporter [Nitrospinae bacterium]|nr:nucleoside:proton symporter [Nitrospinota bacterium]